MSDETTSPREAQLEDQGQTGSLIAFPQARQRSPDNLPLELSSFVGREREIAEVERLLGGDARLVTLYGPGGCGKTRLALAVAQEMVEGFEGGVWWVELASLSDPDLVPGALASALGVREMPDRSLTEVLVEHLKPKETLVVLDNCEHLVEGCAVLADALLRACPGLAILATSREPLRVAGEVTWTVLSLSLPDPGRRFTIGELEHYEAVRLFVERATAVDGGFTLTERNASAVARLCRKLDGIPLAIELAAARVRALTVEQILEKLEDPLSLLTTGSRTAAPRHQTLRATLQWSYELLGEQERELFGRLSVFFGGFTLEAAEAVGAAGSIGQEDVLDLLGTLVEQSLVVAGGDDRRYGMLEPVRQYALEKLEEATEADMVRRRHAAFFLEVAEQAHPQLTGPDQIGWLDRLERENGNLRTAMRWLTEEGEVETAVRLAWALHLFWSVRAYQREGYHYAEEALKKGSALSTNMRAKALFVKAAMSYGLDDPGRTMRLFEGSADLFQQAGDRSGLAAALGGAGFMAVQQGHVQRAMALFTESLTLYRELGDKWGISEALIHLGMIPLNRGDYAQARRYFEEALALAREIGSRHSEYGSLYNLARMAQVQGEHERALHLYAEGLKLVAEVGDKADIAYCLERLAGLAALRGEPVWAARLWGAAEALREQIGMSLSHLDLEQSGYEQDLATVCSTLNKSTFDAAWAEGRAMSPEQAIEYALEALEEPAAAPPTTATVPEPTPSGKKPVETAEARATTTAGLRIFALGPARVEKEGRPLDPSPDWSHKPRELLFYLLSHPSRTKEQIGLALWPEASTSQLRGSFHDTVYRLRRALGAKEWISFHKGRYAFNRSLSYSFDVEAFEENLSEAQRLQAQSPEQAIRHLRESIGLYMGDFLDLAADGEWALERQEELRRAYGETLLLLGRLLLAENRPAEAAEAYRKAIAHDGFLEEAHRELMRCYAALGERGRALKHYEELVELLDEQLGTSPAPETSALYESLRTGSLRSRE